MKKKIIIGAVILVVIAGVVLGLTVFNRGSNNKERFRTEAVDRGDIEALVVTTGSLNPVTIVEVGSQVSGRIAKINVDFNSQVKAGEILAELDQSQFLTQLSQNEANYKSAVAGLEKARVTLENTKKNYERALDLFNKNLIPVEQKEASETLYYSAQAELRSTEARLEQAKSTLESSQVNLTYTIIRSPIDGVVISRNVNVGQTVAASFQAPVLFKIANDLSQMQVECSVDEADIGKVKEAQNVRFTVDAFPNDRFTGKVRQVRYSPEVIQNVVTYSTIVEVKNPELKLRPGMTATASIVTGEAKNALRVPNAALRFNPNLSPEEMKAIMERMRAEMSEKFGGSKQGGARAEGLRSQDSQRPGSGTGEQTFSMRGGSGIPGGQMRQISRVWIEDENRKLKPIFVRTGVTDNSYTEILSGELKEGQLVIVGEDAGRSTSQGPGSSAQRSMRFIMR